MPSELEIRVLAGTGFIDGYTPEYFTDTAVMPQDNWGYTTVAQFEAPENNLLTAVLTNPGNEDYLLYEFSFNSGNNDSVALFIRGIGGPGGGDFDYNSGEEEIRAAFVSITAQ